MEEFKYRLEASDAQADVKGGYVKEARQDDFPILKGMAIYSLYINEGGLRIPHWHPNANELNYCMEGKAEIGIFTPDRVTSVVELEKGDICFIPMGYFHYIKNTGEGTLHMLVMFNNENPNDIGLSEGLGAMPANILGETFNVPPDTFKNFQTDIDLIAPQD